MSVPRELRARRPAGRVSQRLDGQVRAYWGEQAWTCQVCGQEIPRSVPRGDPLSWTKDHVLALAEGGGNDLGNLRPAHLICNQRRQAGRTSPPPARRALRTSRDW